jgi:hypothetical protein
MIQDREDLSDYPKTKSFKAVRGEGKIATEKDPNPDRLELSNLIVKGLLYELVIKETKSRGKVKGSSQEKGPVFDTVQAAGKWLADKWARLENRYGRSVALSMVVATIVTMPLPGSIPAIIAAAEVIRGVRGKGALYQILKNGSFFSECDRDELGHCLPSGQAGAGGSHKPSSREPQGKPQNRLSGSVQGEPVDKPSEQPKRHEYKVNVEVQGTPVNPRGFDTQKQYQHPDGTYSQERVEKVHKPILMGLVQGIEKAPPGEQVLYMTGGGTASGKSTLLEGFWQEVGMPDPSKNTTVRADPDGVKSKIPEYKQRIEAKDDTAAVFTHEESSDVTLQGVNNSLSGGYHTLYDSTGDGGYEKLKKKVEKFRASGASRIESAYAFPGSIETAIMRSDKRAERTGRKVPHAVIYDSHQKVVNCWLNAAQDGLFDKLTLWSTDVPKGAAPKAVATSEGGNITVHDQETFDKFKRVGAHQQASGGSHGGQAGQQTQPRPQQPRSQEQPGRQSDWQPLSRFTGSRFGRGPANILGRGLERGPKGQQPGVRGSGDGLEEAAGNRSRRGQRTVRRQIATGRADVVKAPCEQGQTVSQEPPAPAKPSVAQHLQPALDSVVKNTGYTPEQIKTATSTDASPKNAEGAKGKLKGA